MDYCNAIELLKENGNWNNEIGDLVVRMISETLQRNIIVLRGGVEQARIPFDLRFGGETLYITHNRTMVHYNATRKRPEGSVPLQRKEPTPEHIPDFTHQHGTTPLEYLNRLPSFAPMDTSESVDHAVPGTSGCHPPHSQQQWQQQRE